MSVGFNFLEAPELPAPQVSEAQAEEILASHYGLRARATSLGSQQDKNFVVIGPDGDVVGVLKIANPAFNATEIEAQELAADRIAEAEPSLRIAVGVPNLAGQKCTAITGLVDGTAYVRLLRYLPGGTLQESGYLSPTAVAGLGEVAGRVSRALEGFSHPGLDRVLQWDLRYGADVVAELISHVADPVQRARIEAVARDAWTRIASLADGLPRQAVHLDMTDANVVVSRSAGGSALPDGVIDFGDLSDTWAVSELAITVSSVLGHPGTDPTSILPAVRAFHALRPLRAVEVDAVWPLVVLRTAVLLVSGAQQAVLDPDNPYLTDQSGGERRMFEQATSIPIDVMTEVIRADLGLAGDPRPVTVAVPLVDVDAASVVTLDLATTSDAYDFAFTDDGSLKPGIEDELATAAVQGGAQLVVTQYGQARLSRTRRLSQESPDVVATGISLWPASSTPLVAPWDGEVIADDVVTLRGAEYELTLTGASPVASGRVECRCSRSRTHRRVSGSQVGVRPVGAPAAPLFTRFEMAPGWLALTRDPRPLLGLPAVEAQAEGDLLSRRDASFAPVQEFYYREPPQIERGRRHYLMSTAGRTYLDMVNNVTVLGHAHPRIADTAARQLRRLNTNSRFNYAAVVEFSERLAAMLPDPLDTVFLVNSGSEASDLAIRLATAATGRRDVVAVREAYHGWTFGTDAVSTSIADNPECACHSPGLGPHGRVAQQLSRQVPRCRRREVCGRGGAADRAAGCRRPCTRGVHLRERVRQCGRHGAAGRLSAAGVCGGAGGRWPGDLRRGAGRVRPSRPLVLGFHAAGCGARHHLDRQVDGQRLSARRGDHQPRGRRPVPLAGLFLLVDRRQSAVVRDRDDRPRRAA